METNTIRVLAWTARVYHHYHYHCVSNITAVHNSEAGTCCNNTAKHDFTEQRRRSSHADARARIAYTAG